MDKLTKRLEAAAAKDNFKEFEENLSLDTYGTREAPTVSPLASDKPLQRTYKWFSAAESLANSGVPNLNLDNLVRKGNEHISMVETSHLSPESPRTEAERHSLGRRVSKWKKLVARWEEAAARSAEPAAAAARGPTAEEQRRVEIILRQYGEEQEAEKLAARELAEREATEPLPEGWTRHMNPDTFPKARPYYYHNAGWAKAGAPRTVHTVWSHPGLTPPLPWTPPVGENDPCGTCGRTPAHTSFSRFVTTLARRKTCDACKAKKDAARAANKPIPKDARIVCLTALPARGPTDAGHVFDLSDAGHVPEVLPEAKPDAFTVAAAFFRAAPKSTLGLAENLNLIAVLGRRHLKAVDACRSSWPRDARGTIQGYLMKWRVLQSRWAAAAGAEVEVGELYGRPTLKARGPLGARLWRRARQDYRAKQLKKRTCLMCGDTAPLSSRALSYCNGCRYFDDFDAEDWARYCSEACQRAHWLAGHADECPCMIGYG